MKFPDRPQGKPDSRIIGRPRPLAAPPGLPNAKPVTSADVESDVRETTETARMDSDDSAISMDDTASFMAEHAGARMTSEQPQPAPDPPAIDPPPMPDSRPASPPALTTGMSAEMKPFFKVVTSRSQWTRIEFARAAEKHGRKFDTAIDEINEWAFDRFGEAILTLDGQNIHIELPFL